MRACWSRSMRSSAGCGPAAIGVTYVRNITDIEDKIIRRAVENGETIAALTGRFIAAMHEDEAALGIARPDAEPRATRYVPQMLDMIRLPAGQRLRLSHPGMATWSSPCASSPATAA